MTIYQANPEVTIDAVQWTGNNDEEVREFIGPATPKVFRPGTGHIPASLYVAANDAWLNIDDGEWIARDSAGFYPIKPEIFAKRWREPSAVHDPEDSDVQFEDVTAVVDSFFANEDIVTEGWILIVEPYDRNVRASLDPVHVRVFGNAVSTAHAVGMARMAERRIAATGVEG